MMPFIEIESPKALREALCKAEFALSRDGQHDSLIEAEKTTIRKAIAAIDVARPLGPNGKHGNRHTANCGCELTSEQAFVVWHRGDMTYSEYAALSMKRFHAVTMKAKETDGDE